MIKRIISISSVLVLLVGLLVFPVSAAGTSDGSMWLTSMLDYCSVDDRGNSWTMVGDATIEFQMPFVTAVNYVDMVLYCSSGLPAVTWVHGSLIESLTVESIGSNVYRCYGNVTNRQADVFRFGFSVANTSSTTYCTIFQLNVGRHQFSSTPTTGKLNIAHPSVSSASMLSPTSSCSITISGSSSGKYLDFNGYINVDDWRKFDTLDILLNVDSTTLNSISATMGGVNIPYDYQFIEGNVPEFDANTSTSSASSVFVMRYVRLTLDLTNLKKSDTGSIQINFSGMYEGGNTATLTLYRVTGHVIASAVDAPTYWLRRIWEDIVDGFDRIAELISPESTDTQTSIADAESAIRDVEVMEQQYAAGLDSSLVSSEIDKVGNYGNGLVLCANVLSRTFTQLDGYQIIYILPITIGIYLFICNRVHLHDKPQKYIPPKVDNSSLNQGGSNGSAT